MENTQEHDVDTLKNIDTEVPDAIPAGVSGDVVPEDAADLQIAKSPTEKSDFLTKILLGKTTSNTIKRIIKYAKNDDDRAMYLIEKTGKFTPNELGVIENIIDMNINDYPDCVRVFKCIKAFCIFCKDEQTAKSIDSLQTLLESAEEGNDVNINPLIFTSCLSAIQTKHECYFDRFRRVIEYIVDICVNPEKDSD